MLAKVENGVTKSCQNFRRKNRKTQFWPDVSHFFVQDRLLFARVDIGERRDRISDKKAAEKEEIKFESELFFQKWAMRIPFSMGIFIFLAADQN